MSSQDRNYWVEKAKDKVIWNESQATDAVKELMFIYDETAFEVENRINAMYQKYAEDNKLTSAQANKMLTGKEYSVWRKSIEGYIEDLTGNAANSKTALELNTLAMKSRISREEQLLSEIYRQMAKLAEDTSTDLEGLLSDITQTNYLRSCYNLQVGMAVGFNIPRISKAVLTSLLEYPWAKKNFSKAVWDDVDTLCATARRAITRGFVAGSSVSKITKEINDVMGKGRYVTERLVRTECKYFANQGEIISYKENGITQYVFMGGTEGSIACDCGFYNNKIIDVEKARAGENFPPLHPNCLCTVRAYFKNSIFDDNKDAVPLDDKIGFEDWKKKFIIEVPDLKCNVNGAILNLKMSKHAYERLAERGITLESIKDAVENPLHKSEVITDEQGRPSQKYIGEQTTVAINPETGKIATSWKTGTRTRKKYRKE